MTDGPDNHPGPGSGPDNDVIRPVAYRPQPEYVARSRRIDALKPALATAAALVTGILWFLFTASAVRLEFTPPEAGAAVSGPLTFSIGGVWLLHSGEYRVTATAPGYEPLDAPLDVSDEPNQTHRFELAKLPGLISFESTPPGADVTVGGKIIGTTPLASVRVPAGPLTVEFDKPRYQPLVVTAEIAGKEQAQTVSGTLPPNWADVSVSSVPAGAEILVDDAPTGLVTPAVVQVLAGERELQLRASGHKTHRQRLLFVAQQPLTLPEVRLERADGVLRVQTSPAGAGITLNGQYQGESPLEIAVQSGVNYRVQAFSAGYGAAVSNVRLAPGDERSITLSLDRLTGTLVVRAEPANAELFVNGRSAGSANQSVQLATGHQTIEVRAPGYAAYSTVVTPREGVAQELRVRLLTVEDARMASLQPTTQTRAGQTLVLLKPGTFTMGSSRRQPGRRANESLRQVDMHRMFYLGTKEVTNAEYRKFVGDHDSGSFQDTTLNQDDQPVANVGWEQAALYCNWLSQQERLPLFYRTENGKVVGIDPSAIGYRLPSEAEWEWAARQVGDVQAEELRFPWGNNLPPPDRYGNYADRAATHLVGRIIFGYNDNHIASAPVGTFAASPIGIYDLSGNVAEWVNDYHEIPGTDTVTDPLGPKSGEYRVIRGSSWMNGTITELRIAFRDYGTEGRQDLGFRIARFAEPK